MLDVAGKHHHGQQGATSLTCASAFPATCSVSVWAYEIANNKVTTSNFILSI